MNDNNDLIENKHLVSYHLQRAIDYFGTQTKLAELIGRKQNTISFWLKRGKVPFKFAILIEKITNRQITRYQLKPEFLQD